MPTLVPDLGDIQIDGKPYRIQLPWDGKDIIDFAPRATVPGGAFTMSDLGLFQPMMQTDWRHGFGFHWYSDAMGYMRTEGRIDTRQEGLVMLFTDAVASDTDNAIKRGGCVFNGKFYTWGDSGLRQYDAGAWTSIYSAAAVNCALAIGSYLFFCPDGLRIQKMDTLGVITDAGLDANATDFAWLVVSNGYVYAGKDDSNAVHFSSSETLADLQGNSSDSQRILVGVGATTTLGAVTGALVYNGNLYVKRSDGIWLIGEDRVARRMLDFSAENSENNVRSWAVINGYVVFPLRDRILQWNGARVSDITPHKLTDSFPYVTYGRFDNFYAVGDYLYITARTNEATYDEALLCWDGVGWHKLADLISNSTTDTVTMLTYEAVNNRLWYHLNQTADTTNYIPFQNNSTFPYASFPTGAGNALISSRWDMGFRRVWKSMDALFVEAANCSSSSYLKVYYSLDGEDWVLWDTITQNGVIELLNPGGSFSREFRYMQLKVELITTAAAQTPILEGLTLSFLMRPLTRWGYGFNVIVASNYQQGRHTDDRSAAQIRNDLLAIRNSRAPISLVDYYGVEHIGYITAIQDRPTYRRLDRGGETIDVEAVYHLNFVEVR